MTLDEAIQHGEAIATEYEYEIKEFLAVDDEENAGKCIECRDNHVQLINWLKELKELRILIGGEDNYLTEPTEQVDVKPLKFGEYTIDDICAELAQLIGIPCIFKSAEEIMLHRCKDCGKDIPDSECWRRYFDIKFNTDTDAGEIANLVEFKRRMKRGK